MRWLEKNIGEIEILLERGDQSSLTYAALECRLALELVCYERLRVSHDYISHEEIRRWQPRYVIETLINEVNDSAAESFTFSISTTPIEAENPTTAEEFSSRQYVEVGRQVGFDPKVIGKLWNGLSSFLHVRLPKAKNDPLNTYGSIEVLKAKIAETLTELRRLQLGTLISSGLGEEVSFKCTCGTTNKRRAALLKQDSRISCISPDCRERYRTHKSTNGSFEFERVTVEVKCRSCGDAGHFPEAVAIGIGLNRLMTYDCQVCGTRNAMRWALQQAQ